MYNCSVVMVLQLEQLQRPKSNQLARFVLKILIIQKIQLVVQNMWGAAVVGLFLDRLNTIKSFVLVYHCFQLNVSPASLQVLKIFWIELMQAAVLRSRPRLQVMAVFMIALAVLSMEQSRPEWTMSFSEAPDIRLSNSDEGVTGIRPPTRPKRLSSESCKGDGNRHISFFQHLEQVSIL